jgi:nodulation protein E
MSVAEMWAALEAGRSGISPLEGIESDGLRTRIGGQIKGFDPKARLGHWRYDKTILHSDRYSWLAAAAADEAIRQSGLEVRFAQPFRAGCIVASGAGGVISGERGCRDRFQDKKGAVHPMFLPRIISSSAAAHIGIEFGAKGPTFSICSAGASAAHAIAVASEYIRHAVADIVITGGADSPITYGALLACEALGLLSPDDCRPFDRRRNGTVLAEGAGILVLESARHAEARGAAILAEVLGAGVTAQAADMTSPGVDSAAEAMRRALQDARLEPGDIGYLNAHATGSPEGDRAETEAIKLAFGRIARELPVSSTKSGLGHPFGAAPAIEAIITIEAMRRSWIPPTLGLEQPDPECDLDYVPKIGRKKSVRYAMSSSFGLGGLNASLVLGLPR